MSDDQHRSKQGRFLNHEEDATPVPGPAVPTHFPNPSTGSRNTLGGPTPFASSAQFPNTPTGQFGSPPSGQFPNVPTGQFGAAPGGQFPNTPTGQFGAPVGQFPNTPTGQFGAAPPAHFPNPSTGNRNVLGGPTPFGAAPGSGQFPNTPTGQFGVPASGQFPVSPTGPFPVPPTGQFPTSPTGQFPTSPTGPVVPSSGAQNPPDTRMRLIYGGGGAGIGLMAGLLLGILNSGLEQMTFMEGLSVTIQIAVWFMLVFGIACAFKPQRVEFILKKHGLMDP